MNSIAQLFLLYTREVYRLSRIHIYVFNLTHSLSPSEKCIDCFEYIYHMSIQPSVFHSLTYSLSPTLTHSFSLFSLRSVATVSNTYILCLLTALTLSLCHSFMLNNYWLVCCFGEMELLRHNIYQMEEIDYAYREASMGMPATRPVLEMTIPTSVDKTIAPEGKHVVQLFVQFAPYDVHPKIGIWCFQYIHLRYWTVLGRQERDW